MSGTSDNRKPTLSDGLKRSKRQLGMRVMHLTSVHAWDDVRIFLKQCATLAHCGYDVALAAPRDQDADDSGVRLIAVPRARGRLQRFTRTFASVTRAALREQAHLYHFHDPELIPLALLLKVIGRRVVYDVHENLPEQVLTKPWIPRWLRPLASSGAGLAERLAAALCDGVVAATPAIARRFPAHKTATVQNFPIPGELHNGQTPPFAQRLPHAVYVGGITRGRGICEVVEAIGRLPRSLQARLSLAGGFRPASLQQEVQDSEGWARVDFHGWRSRSDVGQLMREARMGLVTFHPLPNHVDAQPNKLFEYMSAGLPVVASDFPLWREIIESQRCGILVDPKQSTPIAEAICWLLEHPREAERMGRRGRRAVTQRYNWDIEKRNLLTFYRGILHEDYHRGRRPAPIHQGGNRKQDARHAA